MLVPINKIHPTVRDTLLAHLVYVRKEQLRKNTVVIDLRERMS